LGCGSLGLRGFRGAWERRSISLAPSAKDADGFGMTKGPIWRTLKRDPSTAFLRHGAQGKEGGMTKVRRL
jgi:hypothetical protein